VTELSPERTALSDELRQRLAQLSPAQRALFEQKLGIAVVAEEGRTSIPRITGATLAPLTPGQELLWTLQNAMPDVFAYNVPRVLAIAGELDVDALRAALQAIVERHEILRTRFVATADGLRQIVDAPSGVPVELVDLRDPARASADVDADADRLIDARIRVPFDLAADAQLKATVVRTGDAAWKLLLLSHHIVSDEASRDILFRELALLYDAARGRRLADAVAALPRLPVRFADFAAWQQAEIEGGALREQVGYWRERLAGLAALELPTDRPRTATPSFAGARHRMALRASVRAGVLALARGTDSSPFMVLLAAAQAVLHRYTGQRDISVGTPVAGRQRAEVELVVGYFPSAVVLRTDVDPELSFSALLQRVRETCLGAFDHQDVPIERLLAEVTDREDAQGPLFRVAVQMASGGAQAPRLGDAEVRIVPTDVGAAKFDLFIGFEDGADGLRLMLEYRTDLFDPATIERMAGHLATLLEAVVEDPSLQVGAAPLLRESERQQLLHDWSGHRVKYAGGATLVELLSVQAALTPHAVAVEDERRAMTFAQLDAAAAALAHRLREAGVGRGVRVGVCADRSVELVIALVAVAKAGGAYVPFDPEYPLERLAFMMEDAEVGAFLTTSAIAPTLPPCDAPVILLDGVAEPELDVAETPLPIPLADDPAYLIFTSGSTGRPKGALNSHRGIVNRLQWMQSEYELTASDVVLQKTPFSFDVSVWEFFWPLLAGAKLVMAQPGGHRDTGYITDAIVKHGVTVCHFVPSMLRAFLTDPAAARCITLRDVMASGEALAPDLVAELTRVLPGTRLHNLYGPTECAVDVSYWPCPQSEVAPAVVPIGKPVSNTRLYVLDSRGEPTPIGVPGELFLAGVQVGLGYHNRPELTAERFVRDRFAPPGDGPHVRMYRTGDRARWLASGSVEYLGRLDFQVKVRGFRIELGEIETSLLRDEAVRDCVVVAREDGGEQRLVAYVVPTGDAPAASALRTLLLETLPEYMVPSAFVFLDALPLSSNGKVDRRALFAMPAPESDGATLPAAHRAPRTATERALAEIWTSVLRRETLGVDDDFFALGGHSLLAMRMLGGIIERFGVRLPLRVVFERRTIAEIARAVEAARVEVPAAPIPALAMDADAPLSYGQELLWMLQLATPELSAYNIPQLWMLRGALDVAALNVAVQALMERHHALRTVVVSRGPDVVQRVLNAQAQPVVVEDLAAVPDAERATAARRRVEAIAAMPFDLAREPAFRVVVLRLSASENWLLVLTHHAIADGWSIGLLVQELSELYGHAASGTSAQVPASPVAVQFREFAAWQRETRSGEWLAGELAWWRAQLAGAPTSLELPTDRPRSAALSFEGGRRMTVLPASLLARLRALATAQGTTLYSVLAAAYAVLLHRYSGQNEVVVGTVVANRHRADLERTVGYFANTLPLRVSLVDDPSFATVVQRVHDAFLSASEHSDIPFEQLALELHDGARASDPLVQAMFILQNNADSRLELGGIAAEKLEIGAAGAKVELTLSMTELADGLRTVLQFRRALFDEATIDRMLGHLGTLLDAAASDPGALASTIALLPSAERELVTRGWNETAEPLPRWSVPERVLAQAAATPRATAVRAGDGAITYETLAHRSAIVAAMLRDAGVMPGDRVAVCVDRTTTLPVALLGVMRAGAAYVPLDAAYPAERLSHVLTDAGVRVVLTDASSRASLPASDAPVLVLGEATWSASVDARPEASLDPESLAYVLYTSGSTGRPKGVMVPHRALANFLATMAKTPGLAEGDAIVAVTTISFDIAGLELWMPLVVGAEVVLASRAEAVDGAALRALVERTSGERAAARVMLQATPATWRLLVQAGMPRITNLVMLCGGEAWPAGLSRTLAPLGESLWNVYGPTETTIWSTRARVTGEEPSLGEPIANTTLYVLERSGEPSPVGVPGELWIGGAGLARGYHDRPDLTADRFVAHAEFGRLYRTGDLVRRGADGRLDYLGRGDDQVKLRGYRIELGEIESVLAASPSVSQTVASVHRPDDGGEPRLVGYVVLGAEASANEASAIAELYERLRRSLPEYMVPSALVRLDALPLTPNGKVDRRALPAPEGDVAAPARPYVAPRSPLESDIAVVWRDVLGVARVGIDDDFFALGGHSLLAMRVLARLVDVVPARLTLGDLFERRTVAATAALVVQRLATAEADADDDDLAGLLAELEGLSDEETTRQLGDVGLPS
jgi:amino acid adenylation domain-containing protein